LFRAKDGEFQLELFKFKFPLSFYPVTFFIDKNDFPELTDRIASFGLDANDETELNDIVATIIKSDSTLRLLRRLMAL